MIRCKIGTIPKDQSDLIDQGVDIDTEEVFHWCYVNPKNVRLVRAYVYDNEVWADRVIAEIEEVGCVTLQMTEENFKRLVND